MSAQVPLDAVVLLSLIVVTPLLCLLVLASCASYRLARRFKRMPADQRGWIERPWIVRPAMAYLAIYALCFLYGNQIEADWVQTTYTEIKVKEPVLGSDRFRIVHLTDLHLERIGRREYRMVEQVMAAKPQLILLTGDYLNVREGVEALHEVLGAMKAPYGIYGVEGNWDTKFVAADVFERSGATLLVDDTRVLEQGKSRVRLAGHGYVSGRPLKDLLPPQDDGAFTIYLNHKPDAIDELRAREPGQRVDLFLCGHTHGGQVRLPFWGAVITLSKYHKKYEQGLYDVDGVPMYVSRGVGSGGGGVPHIRFLCRPEVAVIDLVYQK